ncbi:MAG: LPS assembly lipoprotein LptE [Sulfuricellaceae bacterium]|nr:LPS assembly lipoprotein LptE [Sulfuricellaceae bacterium]
MWSYDAMNRRILFILLVLLLGGCGFQLRGSAIMPFESLFIESAGVSAGTELHRALREGSEVRLLASPPEAETVLQLFGEQREKRILSLNTSGKVSEYMLLYRLSFRLRDGKGVEWAPAQTLELRRDYTFSDAQVLAKEQEELLLYREMQTDAVRQLMRRLSAMKQLPIPDAD